MCSIFGALVYGATASQVATINLHVDHIMRASLERGRDGWGYHAHELPYHSTGANYERRCAERGVAWPDTEFFNPFSVLESGVLIGNMRAEPTTEFVKDKREFDQQPYRFGKWTIVHNGTIANDKTLRTNDLPTSIDSAAIVERLALVQEFPLRGDITYYFCNTMGVLQGSYAILATHDDFPDLILAACNYRPIWFSKGQNVTYFASSRDYFPEDFVPEMVPPYSCWEFGPGYSKRLDREPATGAKALVVCSGGMDSVVAAKAAQAEGMNIHLLHFHYGSRAEGPETAAIYAVAAALEAPLHIVPMNIYSPQDSPLLQKDSTIAGGEEGAEFAHEWVPARNLVMLSLATAWAEANGFDTLVLGNNLEEAGAYPDNEPEFINRFNDLLPFAVGDGKRLRVVMPVGNLMKHEIVALGTELGAPMGLTWSCYRAGATHCGTCGPCYMRRTAYKINDLPDPIQYAKGA